MRSQAFHISKQAIYKDIDAAGPDVSFVAPMLRRRLTEVEKIALYLARRISVDAAWSSVVFASEFGEWTQTLRLFQQFYTDKEMSPALFSTSVHNASPALLSLVTKSEVEYTAIAAGEKTLEMAVLEASLHTQPCLMIFAEEKTPYFYRIGAFPLKHSCGLALLFDSEGEKMSMDDIRYLVV